MNIRYWVTISLAFIRAILISFFHADPRVNITQGIIKGITVESRNGRYFSSFTRIPFAQPPIGKLRFRNPVPAKGWKGIYSANSDVNECPQLSNDKVIGSEDCLYLNVFTPLRTFNITERSTLLPVMVWIHGGGYLEGSSSTSLYGPNYLLDKDIVLVTMNYRLGVFGFFSTGDSMAPGNFGLKDQVLALKWVQKNIKAFGGDPKQVTLFGESAGGGSVSLHSISDASNGLFHQYILQSGNSISPWNYRKKSDFNITVNQVAKNVGCLTESKEDLMTCLRKMDFKKLIKGSQLIDPYAAYLKWTPTDELDSEGAFLTDSPWNLIAQNKMKDLPFISGNVANEGLYSTAQYYTESPFTPVNISFTKHLNFIVEYYAALEDSEKSKQTIKEFYFKFNNMSENNKKFIHNFTDFLSSSLFVYPEVILHEYAAKVVKSLFYLYKFGYLGKKNELEVKYGVKEDIGVPHGAELESIFSKGPLQSISGRDGYIIDVMVDLWTSFAINGKPTSDKLENSNLWQPYVKNNNFLQIGNISNNQDPAVNVESDYFSDQMMFWKENFPISF